MKAVLAGSPSTLRVRVHPAGLKVYESAADIVALQQVGQLIEIDRQRTQGSLLGVVNRRIERRRVRGLPSPRFTVLGSGVAL